MGENSEENEPESIEIGGPSSGDKTLATSDAHLEFHRRWIVAVIGAVVAVLSMILNFIAFEAFSAQNHRSPCLFCGLGLSVGLGACVVAYHFQQMRLGLRPCCFGHVCFEFILCVLHPLPFLVRVSSTASDINSLLALCVMLRIFFLIRGARLLVNRQDTRGTWNFMLCHIKAAPIIFLALITMLLLLCLSWGLWRIEAERHPRTFPEFGSALWTTLVLLTHAAGPEGMPLTNSGKILSAFIGAVGWLLLAALVVVLRAKMKGDPHKDDKETNRAT